MNERAGTSSYRRAVSYWRVRRRCRRVLQALDLEAPFDIHEMFRRYSDYCGRPIKLHSYPLSTTGPFAVWFRSPQSGTDYVFYAAATDPDHQILLLGHEFGHMVAGHCSGGHGSSLPTELIYALASAGGRWSELDFAMVRRRLHLRDMYDTADEREAELVGTLVRKWASVIDRVSLTRSGDPTLDALSQTLGDRRGWL